jgi:hypothetical protein
MELIFLVPFGIWILYAWYKYTLESFIMQQRAKGNLPAFKDPTPTYDDIVIDAENPLFYKGKPTKPKPKGKLLS